MDILDKIEWAIDTLRNRYKFGLPDLQAAYSREKRAKGVLLDCRKSVKRLQTENGVMREAFNSLADDLQRGEHVEFSWIKESIESAAHSRVAMALQLKVEKLEKQIKG